MNTPVVDMLTRVAQASKLRFCMPGHKGKGGFLPPEVSRLDITELPDADNLYAPQGVIREAQELHAKYIGARESYFLVNGSSCGVHAAVLSILGPGDTVIAARDIHLSAVNAFCMAGVHPVFVCPEAEAEGVPGVVTASEIARAVENNPHAKAVYLTYPNYYGLCADINVICAIAHKAGMKVICDAAHAAAFDFSELLPVSPAQAGCDIWVTSLHKTLCAMNQCAVLNIGANAAIQPEVVRSRLNMLQTTSPSYLLLASCDYSLAMMREEGEVRLRAAVNLMEDNMRRIEAIGGYRCVLQDIPKATGAFDRDILKLVIDVTDRGISGFGAAKELHKNGIDVETADVSNIVLICTIADGIEDFESLKEALKQIRGANYHIARTFTQEEIDEIYRTKTERPMRDVFFAERRVVALEDSVGCIAAASAGAYPPGVPVIMPGQRITKQMIDYLKHLQGSGYGLFGMQDGGIETACL